MGPTAGDPASMSTAQIQDVLGIRPVPALCLRPITNHFQAIGSRGDWLVDNAVLYARESRKARMAHIR
jgi:hypothetical protein